MLFAALTIALTAPHAPLARTSAGPRGGPVPARAAPSEGPSDGAADVRCADPDRGADPDRSCGDVEPRRTRSDPRARYDVDAYRLDLTVDPAARRISGAVGIEARVLDGPLAELVLDLHRELSARGASLLEGALDGRSPLSGRELEWRHAGDLLVLALPVPLEAGARLTVAVRYEGQPRARNHFDGFHWRETPAGEPWIGTSVQGLGAHVWWPCKASFYHPADKPERVFVNATVPAGLTAVSNGVLAAREPGEGVETFRWELRYPCETYAVTLNVAPYVELAGELDLPELQAPVPHSWFVLPESVERAERQFALAPEVLAIYSRRFGPWPFPEAKVGLVETSFWGMEHTTAVAYGSSFPAWLADRGLEDPFGNRNRWFDYILVHELAHEWWGNAVSAADWGDFWLHEGFATYAGGVYVEDTQGRAAADRFFLEQGRFVHPKATLYRGRGTSSRKAFSGVIYSKGACVLNTLRHYLDDDGTWWALLRTFQARHRYGSATTEDFRALLEELTERDWSRFFEQWVYSPGFPRLTGRVHAGQDGVHVDVDNPAEPTGFDVPLDLAWTESGARVTRRLWLSPGTTNLSISTGAPPTGLAVAHLDRLLGEHEVRID